MVQVPQLPWRLRVAILFLIVTLIIVYSIIPLPRTLFHFGPFGLLPIRSYLHFIAYAGFGGSLAAVFSDAPYSNTQIALGVFGIAVGFGFFLELIQLRLPYRHFSYIDIGMNAVGTAIAVLLYRLLSIDTKSSQAA